MEHISKIVQTIEKVASEASIQSWPLDSTGRPLDCPPDSDIEMEAAAEIVNVIGGSVDSANVETLICENPYLAARVFSELAKNAQILERKAREWSPSLNF